MKLCTACKHHRPDHRCANLDYARISPVDGSTERTDCAIQRAAFSLPSCGPEGRGFEAKERDEL